MTTLPKTDRQNIAEQIARRIYMAMVGAQPNYLKLLPNSKQQLPHELLRQYINVMEVVIPNGVHSRTEFAISVRDYPELIAQYYSGSFSTEESKEVVNMATLELLRKLQCAPIKDTRTSLLECYGLNTIIVNCPIKSEIEGLLQDINSFSRVR